VGRCASCRFLYTPLRHPTPEGLFFDTDATVLRVLGRPLAAGERRHYRTPNFLNYLRLIERLAPGRRLLDVGCAQGFFLAEARRQGYEATGVEPSPTMAEYGETVLGLRILKGRLDQVDLGNSQWDAVSFTDSLEYVAEPVGALRLVRPHLAPGGVVFIKVPNGDYFSLRHRFEISFGMTWSIDEAFSPSRRVGHYNTHSLRQLVEKADLKVLEMGPCRPVDSPVWRRLTGLDLEVEAPRFVGLSGRVARRILFGLGTVEFVVTRNTSLSPSLYVLAGRKAI
jgi:SAM-dependent methyltransferase